AGDGLRVRGQQGADPVAQLDLADAAVGRNRDLVELAGDVEHLLGDGCLEEDVGLAGEGGLAVELDDADDLVGLQRLGGGYPSRVAQLLGRPEWPASGCDGLS